MILLLIVVVFYYTFGSLYICQWRRNNISIKSRSQQFSPEISDADEQWRRQQLFFNNTDKLSRISPAHYISSGSGTTTRWSADSHPPNVVDVLLSRKTSLLCMLTRERTNEHPFNGRFSGTTRVSQYQKGKTNPDFTEARDSEWQSVASAGPYASLHLAPDS